MEDQFSFRRILLAVSLLLVSLGLMGAIPASVLAACSNPNQQSCTSNYGVNEVSFGAGGQLCEPGVSGNSANYCAKSAFGELTVGNIASTNYQAQGGFDTNREPSLTFCVYLSTCGDNPTINLGTLTPGTTATTNAKFAVKTYLASGYQVITASDAPKSGSHIMQAPTSPTASNTSAEQFGINLVANNSCGGGLPGSLGASPVQVPDSTFSFGAAAHNSASDYYDTACQFMYQKGDVIANASKSSGETDFTISYIFNTTNVTPGGTYLINQVLVATSTF